jgi:predicted nucleic acid-binding protein
VSEPVVLPPGTSVLAWDSSALLHARRIDRLDVLLYFAESLAEGPTRHVVTAAVAEELSRYGLSTPVELEVVHVDTLAELRYLGDWLDRLSSTEHNRGEATVCAWAQAHGATVIMDDRQARRAAATSGLAVHGTAWLLARAVASGAQTPAGASLVADQLADDGARYPFGPGGLVEWAKANGLLVG